MRRKGGADGRVEEKYNIGRARKEFEIPRGGGGRIQKQTRD